MVSRPRVGVIGYGFIGRNLVERISDRHSGMDLAFVYNRSEDALADLDRSVVLADLAEAGSFEADLIVETAHPTITIDHGASFLAKSSYMPLSTTALVDDDLRSELINIARSNGTKLFLAAGALIGGEALTMRQDQWRRVRITFRKHPKNIDFSDRPDAGAEPREATVIYEGPVRGIATQFPRNVNTMVTCALLSTGLDACEAILVSDPTLDCAIAEVEAWGHDGGYFRTEKKQPAIGVSGTEMVDSVWLSVIRATGNSGDALVLV